MVAEETVTARKRRGTDAESQERRTRSRMSSADADLEGQHSGGSDAAPAAKVCRNHLNQLGDNRQW